MSYRLFLLPSSNYITKKYPEPLNEFPTQIVSLVNNNPESSVIITKNKPPVMVQFPKAKVFEKNLFGEPNESIIEYITETKPMPRIVVLDRCFYEINGYLFNKILELRKKQGFDLVNITNIQTVLELPESIKMTEANQVDFPMCCVQKAIQFFHNHTSKFSFYEPPDEPIKQPVVKEDAKEEEINRVANHMAKEQLEEFELKQNTKPKQYLKHCYVKTEKPPVVKSPEKLQECRRKMDEINKTEFHFYKTLLDNLQCVVDMELFHGFLKGIIHEKSEQNPDYSKEPECRPILNLEFITCNYFNRKRLPNLLLTKEMIHNYINRIQPEIRTLLINDPELFERIHDFFIA